MAGSGPGGGTPAHSLAVLPLAAVGQPPLSSRAHLTRRGDLSSPTPLPAQRNPWASLGSGARVHSPFRWSPLQGPRGPAAPSRTGVVGNAPVCGRSTALPFAMATTRHGGESRVMPRPLNNETAVPERPTRSCRCRAPSGAASSADTTSARRTATPRRRAA